LQYARGGVTEQLRPCFVLKLAAQLLADKYGAEVTPQS